MSPVKINRRSYCFLLFGVIRLSGSVAEFSFFFLDSYQFANRLLYSLDYFVFVPCRIHFYSFIIAENPQRFFYINCYVAAYCYF